MRVFLYVETINLIFIKPRLFEFGSYLRDVPKWGSIVVPHAYWSHFLLLETVFAPNIII